jgi:hypothetical protein
MIKLEQDCIKDIDKQERAGSCIVAEFVSI